MFTGRNVKKYFVILLIILAVVFLALEFRTHKVSSNIHGCLYQTFEPSKGVSVCSNFLDAAYPGNKGPFRVARARYYFAKQDYLSAIQDLEQIGPDSLQFTFSRGLIGQSQSKLGNHQSAADIFAELLKSDPDSRQYKIRYSAALRDAKQFDTLFAFLERAVQAEPESEWVWLQYGLAYKAIGDDYAAYPYYLQHLRLRPKNYKAFRGLSQLCRDRLKAGDHCPRLTPSASSPLENLSCADVSAAYAQKFGDDPDLLVRMWSDERDGETARVQATLLDFIVNHDNNWPVIASAYFEAFDAFYETGDRNKLAQLPYLDRLMGCRIQAYKKLDLYEPKLIETFKTHIPLEVRLLVTDLDALNAEQGW